jgi:hypothetical protein
MLHACYLLFIMCLCMSVKSSTELMLYVVLTMPTLNKAYLFIYLFIYHLRCVEVLYFIFNAK